MVQNAEEPRRGRGRPQVRPDCDTRALLLRAAREEFQAKGYAAASMAAVAGRAGVSTRTLYRLIPTKAALFRATVVERIDQFLDALDPVMLDRLPIDQGLEHLLTAFGRLTLDGETVAIYRLVLGECPRFPELAQTFYEVAIQGTSAAMAAWLQRQVQRGLVAVEDPMTAVGLLRGLMLLEPQRAIMFGQRQPPDEAEIAARARLCAAVFLDGCRVRSSAWVGGDSNLKGASA